MPVYYHEGNPEEHTLGYWMVEDPDMADMEALLQEAGHRDFTNIVVSGQPKEVSPEWLARHPGWAEGDYDYASSYSIYTDDLEDIMNNTSNPVDAFNMYLEGTGKEWIDITEIKIVDRPEPFGNTF